MSFFDLLRKCLVSSDIRSDPLDHRDAGGVLGLELVQAGGLRRVSDGRVYEGIGVLR